MDRIYDSNVSATPPNISYPGSYGFTQENSNLTNFDPTVPGAFWYHYVTESIRNVIVAAGLTPDGMNLTQFYQAVAIIVGSITQPTLEFREDYTIELREDYSYEERE